MNLYFESPSFWIVVCVLAGIGFAALMYYREKNIDATVGSNKFRLYLLSVLRFLVATTLAILLLNPYLRIKKTQTKKPQLVILKDNSESVKNSFKKGDSVNLMNLLGEVKRKLSDKYEIIGYSFSDKIAESLDSPFNGKATNISEALNVVAERHHNRNLHAVLLISDGIYNQGENPIYTSQDFPSRIFTLALGDTIRQRDFKIRNIFHNKTADINEQIPVKIETEAVNFSGKVAELKIFEVLDSQKNILRYNKIINIGSPVNIQSFDLFLPVSAPGVIHYRATLTELEGEATYKNNQRDFFVEVLENKEEILILYNAPHPDVGALRSAIEQNKKYKVTTAAANEFSGTIQNYSLIILHQIPSINNKGLDILQKCKVANKPLLFVIGTQTSIPELAQWQNICEINASNNKLNEATAVFNNNFGFYGISRDALETITRMPPLSVPFGNFKVNPAAQIVFFQKINNVITDFPLIALHETGQNKSGLIAGEGIWRWRLYDFMQNQSHNSTNEIWMKMIQFLCVKPEKRPFIVNLPKNVFNENEQITFDARLFNANYEAVNTPDVSIVIKNNSGNEYRFDFARSDNYYILNAGNLPAGSYSYTAKTILGGKQYTATGKFNVSPLQLEYMRTTADFELMTQLALKNRGKVYSLSSFENFINDITTLDDAKPVIYESSITESAIHLRWIFFLVVAWLAAEWIIRKISGSY
ncbi:MAG: hypothetical protein RMJ53_02145 [Chitinophagales bacterium]|nr:hypothetical protein [Chitinophagales bacterium]MDW8273011.1 hypothetical protein [Chitinophagales bacterium]